MKTFLLITLIITQTLQKEKSYYEILGIKRNATLKEIKKSFKKLSKKYHPDVSSAENANQIFTEINEAYDVLKDEDKRRKYDRFGKEGLKETPSRSGFDIFDMFGGNGSFEREEEQGEALKIPISVSLEDLYNGRKLKIIMTKKSVCSHCRGSGAEDPDDVETCELCQGRGIYIKRVQVAPGFIQQIQQRCPKCHGKGKIIKSKCQVCEGKKILDDLETYQIEVEKGMAYEETITLTSSAGDYVDKSSSDLVFVIKESEHSFFKRKKKNDLEAKIEITLKEALLGFQKFIKHLDGRFIKIERDRITQPNTVIKIDKEGMPKYNYGKEKGDLFVECVVKIPSELTEKQKSLFEKFFAIQIINQFIYFILNQNSLKDFNYQTNFFLLLFNDSFSFSIMSNKDFLLNNPSLQRSKTVCKYFSINSLCFQDKSSRIQYSEIIVVFTLQLDQFTVSKQLRD